MGDIDIAAISDSEKISYVGKISGVFGIKGWVKIVSHTQPTENIFRYSPWLIRAQDGNWQEIVVEQSQRHKMGWIARLRGVNNRNDAESYSLKDIAVPTAEFKKLEDGDYYWHQLIGLRVLTSIGFDGHPLADNALVDLGYLHEMLETGANDVMVVNSDVGSIDDQSRTIPYVPEVYVESINIDANRIVVAWHPED